MAQADFGTYLASISLADTDARIEIQGAIMRLEAAFVAPAHVVAFKRPEAQNKFLAIALIGGVDLTGVASALTLALQRLIGEAAEALALSVPPSVLDAEPSLSLRARFADPPGNGAVAARTLNGSRDETLPKGLFYRNANCLVPNFGGLRGRSDGGQQYKLAFHRDAQAHSVSAQPERPRCPCESSGRGSHGINRRSPPACGTCVRPRRCQTQNPRIH